MKRIIIKGVAYIILAICGIVAAVSIAGIICMLCGVN